MTAKPADQKTSVLLSWVSVNHRAAPLLTALRDSDSPCHWRKTAEVFLYWRDVEGADGDREREARAETEEKLRFEFKAEKLKITFIPWKTTQSPTDHEAIRGFVEKELKKVRADHLGKIIVIHLSPGTPAMHAVWLALGSTGFVEDPVELIQTADERAQACGQPAVRQIDFRLDTWLWRYRNARPGKNQANDDDGHTWDPSTVKSPALRNALEKLQLWAPLRVPVLLLGERGTGKTTLANFLRAMSPYQKTQRSSKAFNDWPSVVCGQFRVNPELARSELFGHVSGAFTGASKDRKGLLEEADGESLFFDEIAEADSKLKCNTCHPVRYADAQQPQELQPAPARRARDAGQPQAAKLQHPRHGACARALRQHRQPRAAAQQRPGPIRQRGRAALVPPAPAPLAPAS